MEDVTLNVDNCNRDAQEYIDSRENKPPSDNRPIRSWIERCQSKDVKSNIEKQRNENKYVEHAQENLFDLANRLNALTLQGTEQEERNVHRDKKCPPESVLLTHRKEKK